MIRKTLTLLVAVALVAAAASSAASSERFVSNRYGYSLTLTTTWSVDQPKQPWNGGTPLPHTVDTYSGSVYGRWLLAAAMRLAAGKTLEDFTADVLETIPGNCGKPESNVAAKLGGEPARLFTHHCSHGWYLIYVTAVHRDRGYVFVSASTARNDRGDRIVFYRALKSWRFTR